MLGMYVYKYIACCEDNKHHINAHKCGKSAVLLNVTAGGTYITARL